MSSVIEEAIHRLPDGELRFFVKDYPVSHACLTDLWYPNESEWLSSDYGLPSGEKKVEEEYFEEIKLIQEILVEEDIPIQLSGWQKSDEEHAERMMKGLNRRAYAIQMWDWYAIPWRLRDEAVYVIVSPNDVMGTPIINRYDVNDFLFAITDKTVKQQKQKDKLHRKLFFWKTFGVSVLFIFGLVLLVVIRVLFDKWTA